MKRSMLMLTGCAVLMFTACGGKDTDKGQPDGNGGGSTQPTNPTNPTQPTTLTVSGRVLDSRGNPLSNATVFVLGKMSVTSDNSGTFSVSDVKPPYDIVAVNDKKQFAIVYKGVTRKDPQLSMPFGGEDGSLRYTAKVTGKVTGARTPSDMVSKPELVFASTSSVSDFFSFEASDSSYTADMSWAETNSVSGSILAFQGDTRDSSSGITKYTGFGRRDNVTLRDGATVANQNIAIGAVASSTITGTLTVPEGYMPAYPFMSMELSPELGVSLNGEPSVGKTFSYPVPAVPQSTFALTAVTAAADLQSFSSAGKRGLTAGATNVTLNLKPYPSLQTPADKASGVARATEFSWIPSMQGGMNIITLSKDIETPADTQSPQAAAQTPFSITIVTSESRTTIPDLSTLGMALPASTDFTWRVQTIGPIASIDSQLTGGEPTAPPSNQTELYFGSSAPHGFKTAATP